MVKRSIFRPRTVDRAIFAILALLHICNGVYLVGPWYIQQDGAIKAPLYHLFSDSTAVAAYGLLLLIDGLFLLHCAFAEPSKKVTVILDNALIAGFLLRLYALVGVFLTLESWRPPSYLSHISTVFVLGAMWVWVRVSERTTR
jgi:hypothetical protein